LFVDFEFGSEFRPRRYCRQSRQVLHRGDEFAFRRLFQQFIIDAWAICDQMKLTWFRTHQQTIRADLYQGVVDILSRGDVQPAQIGRQNHSTSFIPRLDFYKTIDHGLIALKK